MRNQKVYLAKSNLASGLDFEYVKSNLLRIPYVEIIEYGQGYEPSECACMIYVHSNVTEIQEDETILVNKSVSDAMIEFMSQSDDGSAIAGIFLYLGKSHVSERDMEPTTPYMVPANGIIVINEAPWDAHANVLITAPEGLSLLDHVSHALGEARYKDWEAYRRYADIADSYALPPIPSIELRQSRGTRRVVRDVEEVINTQVATPKPKLVLPKQQPKQREPIVIVEDFEDAVVAEEEEEDDNYIPVEVLITGRKPRRRR
jgi:hypothetical protein